MKTITPKNFFDRKKTERKTEAATPPGRVVGEEVSEKKPTPPEIFHEQKFFIPEKIRSAVTKNATLESQDFCTHCPKCDGEFFHSLFRSGPWLCVNCYPPDSEHWRDAPFTSWPVGVQGQQGPPEIVLGDTASRDAFPSRRWLVLDRRACAMDRAAVRAVS